MEDDYGDVNEEELNYKFYMKQETLDQYSDEETLDSIKTWVECFIENPAKTEEEKAKLCDTLLESLYIILVKNGRTPFNHN